MAGFALSRATTAGNEQRRECLALAAAAVVSSAPVDAIAWPADNAPTRA